MADETKLVYPQNTIEMIRKYQFGFQKKLGQNFLIDPHVTEKIVEAAGVTKDDCVLEIGPGIGTLTQFLAEAAGSVAAVEIDANLIPILKETLAEYPNVTVLHADILKVDLKELSRQYNQGRPMKVVANLPYYITTPILMELLESRLPLESITVMVQKEVAERMCAVPGGKDYGALSLAVRYYTRPEIAATVPPNCFIPRPTVGSSVVHMTIHPQPPVSVKDEAHLFSLIRAAFNQRRKTLVNSLSNAGLLPEGKEAAAGILKEMGLFEKIRGEALSLEQFAQRSDRLLQADAGIRE